MWPVPVVGDLSWALHKPKVDPAPLARFSQSPKEETCLVKFELNFVNKFWEMFPVLSKELKILMIIISSPLLQV